MKNSYAQFQELEIEINSQKTSKFIKDLTIKTIHNLQPGKQTNFWKNKLLISTDDFVELLTLNNFNYKL